MGKWLRAEGGADNAAKCTAADRLSGRGLAFQGGGERVVSWGALVEKWKKVRDDFFHGQRAGCGYIACPTARGGRECVALKKPEVFQVEKGQG